MTDNCSNCGRHTLRPITEEMLNDDTWKQVEAMWQKAFADVVHPDVENLRRSNAELILKLNDMVGMYDTAMSRYATVVQENTRLSQRVAQLEAGA